MTSPSNPQPMGSFDPSKAAYLHESLNDYVIVWNPACAAEMPALG